MTDIYTEEALKIVRAKFNPSTLNAVDHIKVAAAQYIALLLAGRADAMGGYAGSAERLYSIALTAAEESAMWAVKAATSNLESE